MRPPRSSFRRTVGAAGLVMAVGAAFGAGMLSAPDRSDVPVGGVLDDAAEQIASSALHPVDRGALDAAAIDGMLAAAGDPWGARGGGVAAAGPGLRRDEPSAGTVVRPAGRTVDQGVVQIAVGAFEQGVGRQVRAAVAALPVDRRGVLLDLRGNAGGRLDEAVETASAFLDAGPVVSYERRGMPPQQLDAVGTGDTTTPLVVLVDGGTASAAEVVAGALQDRGRAVLVGSRTFGKGSVQEPTALPDGSSLELTVARWRTPSGRSVDGTGLVPDIEVAPGLAPEVAARRGAEVLTGLLAAAGGRG